MARADGRRSRRLVLVRPARQRRTTERRPDHARVPAPDRRHGISGVTRCDRRVHAGLFRARTVHRTRMEGARRFVAGDVGLRPRPSGRWIHAAHRAGPRWTRLSISRLAVDGRETDRARRAFRYAAQAVARHRAPCGSSPDEVRGMNATRIRTVIKWTAGALGVAGAAYAAYVATAWARYGRAAPPNVDDADVLLDRFMPAYDIAERHHIRVAAP